MRRILAAAAVLTMAVAGVAGGASAAPVDAALFAKLARTPGETVLPGLAWTVLKSGPADGERPYGRDTVTFRYVGRFSDGRQFDASGGDGTGTYTAKPTGLIPGMMAVLRLMRPGDKWRVTLPAYLAYGDLPMPEIPVGSTLVFDVELVSFVRAPPPAPAAPLAK